jgi:hypothetical protein
MKVHKTYKKRVAVDKKDESYYRTYKRQGLEAAQKRMEADVHKAQERLNYVPLCFSKGLK